MKRINKSFFFIMMSVILIFNCFLLIGCSPKDDKDAPVFKSFSVYHEETLNIIRLNSSKINIFNVGDEKEPEKTYLQNFENTEGRFVAGSKINLEIKIENPENYSISRFKINTTTYTIGSFTTDPIESESIITAIRINDFILPEINQDMTLEISDIKYVLELGDKDEKKVKMPADSVQKINFQVIKDFETSGIRYYIENNEVYVVGHETIDYRNNELWNPDTLERVILKVPSYISGLSVTHFSCSNDLLLYEIDLPDTITKIDAVYVTINLTKITIRAIIPPALPPDNFFQIEGVSIYVPAASVAAYKAVWPRYANNIYAI